MGKSLGGRPKKEIDKTSFEKLCELQCTKNEICHFFDCDEKTLTRWCKETYNQGFSDVFEQKRVVGKIALRRFQMQQAEKNPTMAIWLGKQMLGQKDISQMEIDQKVEQKNPLKDLTSDELRKLIDNLGDD